MYNTVLHVAYLACCCSIHCFWMCAWKRVTKIFSNSRIHTCPKI